MHDPPGDREGPAEQCLGTAQITVGQYLAQPRAADTLAIHLDGGGRLDTEAFGGASLEQEVEVAGAVTAETEIVAHFKMPHAEAFNQRGVDELRGTQLSQAAIERRHSTRSTPCSLNSCSFSRKRVSRAGALSGEKNSRGCGSKITTQLGSPNSAARSRKRARMA